MTLLVALAYADEHRAAEVLATLQRLRTGTLIDRPGCGERCSRH